MISKFDSQSSVNAAHITKRKGTVFLQAWSDLVFSRVEVRGIVVSSVRIGDNGFQLTIDDGTGGIACVAWMDEQKKVTVNLPEPDAMYNKFVMVRGVVAGYRTDVQIKIESLKLIATSEEPTEEALWWFEVKEEWETLAALSRRSTVQSAHDDICPCLCHACSGSVCRTLGNPSAWSRSFNMAVAVVSSALKRLGASRSSAVDISVGDVLAWVASNVEVSPCLVLLNCSPHCAVFEAFNQLLREGVINRISGNRFQLSWSRKCPEEPEPEIASEPRYPLTPFELSQVSQPVIDASRPGRAGGISRPLFRATSTNS